MKAEKNTIMKYIKYILVQVFLFSLVTWFFLFWQASYDILNFANATLIAFVLCFFIGWMIFISNFKLFGPIAHGFKLIFSKVITGRPTKSYADVVAEHETTSKIAYLSFFYSSIPFLVLTIIFHSLYYASLT